MGKDIRCRIGLHQPQIETVGDDYWAHLMHRYFCARCNWKTDYWGQSSEPKPVTLTMRLLRVQLPKP